jgi:hypothetical protein
LQLLFEDIGVGRTLIAEEIRAGPDKWDFMKLKDTTVRLKRHSTKREKNLCQLVLGQGMNIQNI